MENLTVSQALRRVKKLKGELGELRDLAREAVTYVASREPAFPFNESIEKIKAVREELIRLQSRIALTNATTKVKFGANEISVTEAIRHLEEFKSEIAWLQTLGSRDHEKTTEDEWSYSDDAKRVKTVVEYRCMMPKTKQAAAIKFCKDEFDKLNDAVERMNHQTLLKS